MPTSGSVDFSVNRNTLVNDALIMLGAVEAGDTVSADTMSFSVRQLNLLIKSLQAKGLGLWCVKKGYVFLNKGTSAYSLGPTGSHTASSYITTKVKVAATTGATTIDVDSTSGMTTSSFIGIVLDSGNIHWTTILAIPDGDTITIPAPGLPSAAAVGKVVFNYTTKINRPLQIMNGVLKKYAGNIIPMENISREEFVNTGFSVSTGQPTEFYFDPQLNNAVVNVYPAPNDSSDVLEIYYQRPLEDMDTETDSFDFPQEWLLYTQCSLALLLSPAYSAPASKISIVKALLEIEEEKLVGFDRENNTSMYIKPDITK